MLISRSLCIKLMEDALLEPVHLDCGLDAARVRQAFYSTRKYCDSWGDDKFMFLRFRVDGATLIIERHPDPEAVRWRYKLRTLREAVSYALSRSRGGPLDGKAE